MSYRFSSKQVAAILAVHRLYASGSEDSRVICAYCAYGQFENERKSAVELIRLNRDAYQRDLTIELKRCYAVLVSSLDEYMRESA